MASASPLPPTLPLSLERDNQLIRSRSGSGRLPPQKLCIASPTLVLPLLLIIYSGPQIVRTSPLTHPHTLYRDKNSLLARSRSGSGRLPPQKLCIASPTLVLPLPCIYPGPPMISTSPLPYPHPHTLYRDKLLARSRSGSGMLPAEKPGISTPSPVPPLLWV